MPRLSIIVPVYNAEAVLDRALDSVLAQTFQDWELILVDDGSTDGSPALCDARAAADSRVRVFHQRNAGPSESRNRGLDAAGGTYVAFLDADDALAPEAYETLFHALDSSGADCACCGYRQILAGAPGEDGMEPPPLPAGVHGPEQIRDGLVLPLLQDRLREGMVNGMIWRWLLRRDAIGALSLRFSGGYYEDELFLIRYFLPPRRLVCVEQYLYHYYLNPDSVIHRYYPGFPEFYRSILEQKAELIARAALPVRPDWRDNCAWAGLLAAVGNEFAPGGPQGTGTHVKNLRALCALPDFAHALAHYRPTGMNRRKTVVAAFLRRRAFLPLVGLYTLKNRR